MNILTIMPDDIIQCIYSYYFTQFVLPVLTINTKKCFVNMVGQNKCNMPCYDTIYCIHCLNYNSGYY